MIAVSEANGSNGVNVYLGGTKVVNGAGPKATTSTWYHVAIARTGSTLNTYFNGTRVNQTANSTNINDSGSILYIGTLDGVGSTNDNWPGNISNFRWTKGTCLYNTNTITVPTSNLTTGSFTKLLLLMQTSNTLTTDSTGLHTITNNNGTWSSLAPF